MAQPQVQPEEAYEAEEDIHTAMAVDSKADEASLAQLARPCMAGLECNREVLRVRLVLDREVVGTSWPFRKSLVRLL